ncbi:type VII secretion protein EssB [Macrococcus capreoli]|uniref:type VII secretion protein EssB n=1 Tax=Macrococcus capreoli TaxID=2982690 RepID=UPI003EE5E00B
MKFQQRFKTKQTNPKKQSNQTNRKNQSTETNANHIKAEFNAINTHPTEQFDTLTTFIPKSDAINASAIDLNLLVKPHQHLLDATLISHADQYEVSYTLQPGDIPFSNITQFERIEQMRYLLNISSLFQMIKTRYTFILHPDQLYFSKDGIPKIKQRGIQNKIPPTKLTEQDFLKAYKAIITHVFEPSIQFEALQEGVLPETKLSPFLAQINAQTSVAELSEVLKAHYLEEKARFDQQYRYYPKQQFNLFKYGTIISTALAIVLGAWLVYTMLHTEKIKQSIIEGYQHYQNHHYSKVIDTYKDIDAGALSKNELFVYADSYLNVNEQGLEDSQIQQIKNMVSVNARKDILEYWYKMGHTDYEAALNLSEVIGSNDMQKLALMNIINDIKTEDMNREKRDEQLKPYQEKLDTILSKEKEAEEEAKKEKENQEKAAEEAEKNKEAAQSKVKDTKKSEEKSK